ncbi:hypothetical protein [Gemmobacter caeruleus]|uniref:hypothetical protein n=1 Tax=Gemmobacter caeruleus TaxID=2595004 RepID=UPI001EF11D56|nr:hypothetical protein [Gemmobacter caeruleus]
MSAYRFATLALMTIALASPALAQGKGHGHGKEGKHGGHAVIAQSAGHCPPGLAKKSPACIPPGQAKKHQGGVTVYRPGEVIDRDYIVIRDPGRYGLPDGTYYRVGDYLYRVDRDTRAVLDLIGAVNTLLN